MRINFHQKIDSQLNIFHNDVHIWPISLHSLTHKEKELFNLLSEEEKTRVQNFKFDHLKRNYTLSHGVLRLILSNFLQRPAQKITFSFGKYGKPYVKDNPVSLQFNMSHSHNMAIIALTQNAELGIDIELLKTVQQQDELPLSIFSERELKFYLSLTTSKRKIVFFKSWVCKEAFLKTLGTGLNTPMQDVEIQFSFSLKPSLLAFNNDRSATLGYTLLEIAINANYVGALGFKNI